LDGEFPSGFQNRWDVVHASLIRPSWRGARRFSGSGGPDGHGRGYGDQQRHDGHARLLLMGGPERHAWLRLRPAKATGYGMVLFGAFILSGCTPATRPAPRGEAWVQVAEFTEGPARLKSTVDHVQELFLREGVSVMILGDEGMRRDVLVPASRGDEAIRILKSDLLKWPYTQMRVEGAPLQLVNSLPPR
jgi:hypothetical protein